MKNSLFCTLATAVLCLLGTSLFAQTVKNSPLMRAVVSKPMGICYVDVNRCADVVQRLLKANPELQKELEGSFMNDDFFNAVRCLGAKVVLSFQDFSDFDNDQFAVAVQVDEKIPLNTMWKGFAPLFEDDLPEEFSMPASGENILLFGEVSQRKEMEENLAIGQVIPSMVLEGIPADAMLYCVLRLDTLGRQLSDAMAEEEDVPPALAKIGILLGDALAVNLSWSGLDGKEANGRIVCNLSFRHEASAKEFSEALLEFRDFLKQELLHVDDKEDADEVIREAKGADEFLQMIVSSLDSISVEHDRTLVRCEVSHVDGGEVILAGTLLPALAQAREKSRQINCVNQMKQCLLSLLLYVEDHDGMLPPAEVSDEFLIYLSPSREILDCPVSGAPYRYCGNEEISHNSIEHPSRTILMFCCQEEHEQAVVGFADGHVECMDKELLLDILDACEPGELPVGP
ncbi:MAG: hypothetical protein IKS83_08460 [Victivallales bacterium]|nr:hypothetical protein [Victivallales bacterium]